MNATTATAPATPPTCAKLAAAAGMTRDAFRVQIEWSTLAAFTRLMAEAEAVALDTHGRQIPELARRVGVLRSQRLGCVLVLMELGVPASVIESVTHA